VTVYAPANIPPTAYAGANITITLPVNYSVLKGYGTDEDGTIMSYKWTKKSDPASFSIVNSNDAKTEIKNLLEGVYEFELTVTDNKGATANSIVKITVNPAPNIPPTVNAGANKTITLPENSVVLSGSGTDVDGTISSYKWTKKSGPTSYNIVRSEEHTSELQSRENLVCRLLLE